MKKLVLNQPAELKSIVKFGNLKLPKTTMIFNMSSATDCPSRRLGLCEYEDICYAKKPEMIYPKVLPYRRRQEGYWLFTDADKIVLDCYRLLLRKNHNVDAFRFNESGDFHSQDCVEKLDYVARHLSDRLGIITYGYTARNDLDFSSVGFVVRNSTSKPIVGAGVT